MVNQLDLGDLTPTSRGAAFWLVACVAGRQELETTNQNPSHATSIQAVIELKAYLVGILG